MYRDLPVSNWKTIEIVTEKKKKHIKRMYRLRMSIVSIHFGHRYENGRDRI